VAAVYKAILADPPWNESGGGKCKRGADRHYPLMKTSNIINLLVKLLVCRYEDAGDGVLQGPVAPHFPVADNAHLWLWVTNNYLPDGLAVMQALGFRYVTNVAWAKMTRLCPPHEHGPYAWRPQNPGLGQYLAGQHELLLFGVRGKLPALWKDKASGARRQGTLICAPRGKHSAKPDAAYEVIENVSPGPRLELFARGEARPGWDTWGNQATTGEKEECYE